MTFNKKNIIGIIFALLAILGICLYLFLGSVKVTVSEICFTVEGTLAQTKTVYYEDVESAAVIENADIGFKTVGLETLKTKMGQYHSDQYGAYSLYIYKSNADVVVATLKNGEVIIFNCKTADETQKVCDQINQKITEASSDDEETPVPENLTDIQSA